MARFFRFVILFSLLVALLSFISFNPIIRLFYPIHYRDIIGQNATERELDPFLIAAVIQVESGFRPTARSPKGAIGLMQLMPETGNWVATQLRLDGASLDLTDPEINIKLGSWYLKYLNQQFVTILPALAAYNGGQGNVRQWLDSGKWDGHFESIADIPFYETRAYVGKVIHTWQFLQRIYDNRWET